MSPSCNPKVSLLATSRGLGVKVERVLTVAETDRLAVVLAVVGRRLSQKEAFDMPSTIDDPAILTDALGRP